MDLTMGVTKPSGIFLGKKLSSSFKYVQIPSLFGKEPKNIGKGNAEI
jgi:hypothetical protein